jgi:hypothetical protein
VPIREAALASGSRLRTRAHRAFQRLLTLRLPDTPPRAEDRIPAKELFANLEELTPAQRLAVVRIATEYQPETRWNP